MSPETLNRPFIGISLYEEDYRKVEGLLPTASCRDILYSISSKKIILIYQLEGYIASPNQYRWISNIKLGLEKYLFVPFEYVEEFYITGTTEIANIIYTIDELSKAFKAPLITYPKIMYPSTKKELYRHLCWYGKRLIHKKCFTKDVMMATALLMNSKLKDKYSSKDLHKKVLGVVMWIEEHKEGFAVRLDEKQLKEAHSKGAILTNKSQREKTKAKIFKLLKDDVYFKPNGKVNKTLLAKELGMNRRSLDPYLKDYKYDN